MRSYSTDATGNIVVGAIGAMVDWVRERGFWDNKGVERLRTNE